MNSRQRRSFKDAWVAVEALAYEAERRTAQAQVAKDAIIEATGAPGEPIEWCEGCGQPFFDGDDYASDGDVACCREGGPCYDPDNPEDSAEPESPS